MKKHYGTIIIGLFIVSVLAIYWVTFTVRWKETALVTSFGKITKVVEDPGLKYIMPWNKVIKFDTRIRTLVKEATEVSTRDKQNVILVPYVNWFIEDAELFYKSFRKTGVNDASSIVFEGERQLKNFMAEACNVMVQYDLNELVTLDASRFKFPQIEKGPDGMFARIEEKLTEDGGFGITIVDVGIRKFNIPETVTTSVFNRMRQDRMKEVSRLQSEGASKAMAIRGVAQAEAQKIIAEAEGEATKIRGQGDAEAAKFYTVFSENKKLWEHLTKLDTLKITLKERATFILDAQTAPFEMLMERDSTNKGGNK